jgi:hypothetical protein
MCYKSVLQFVQVCMLYSVLFLNNTVSSIYTVIWDICSFGCVTDRQGKLYLGYYELIAHLDRGRFGQVILAKNKSTGGRSPSKEFFALKIVPHPCVSEVEKEVLIQAFGHPFLVQLLSYFQTDVCCSCKQLMSVHWGVSVWRQNQELHISI